MQRHSAFSDPIHAMKSRYSYSSSDDEGGKCANGKSAVILSSVEGLEYNVAVHEYYSNIGQFGIVVSEK